jgi:hypothetical protein
VPPRMPADTVQMQMIRRYARILREQQAQYRGPRIGARERRVKDQSGVGEELLGAATRRREASEPQPGSAAS